MQRAIRLLLISICAGASLNGLAAVAQAAPAAGAPVPATLPVPSSPLASTKAVSPRAEPPVGAAGPVGDYLRAVHGRLHGRWTETFVKVVAATYPPTHPLNNPSHVVTLSLTIRWDGTIADLALKKTSGSKEFDRAAMDVTRKGAPYPLPTPDVVSDDTYAHLEWTFARDHRSCAADARLNRVDDPLDISLPRLISGNKVGEALRRVAQAPKDGEGGLVGQGGLDRFARLYLGRTTPDPVLNITASLALVESGDKSQAARLRGALGSRATVDLAARGLHKLGLDVCDVVRQPLQTGTTLERELAMQAARAAATSGAPIGNCAAPLSAIVSDGKQPKVMRLAALDMLVTFIPAASATVVAAAQQDKDPAVRGAALLASVRKGAGRPETYRLAPLLHDKTVEVRGAASAGMIRAAGDSALDQLYLLSRETDPRPGQAVAAELAGMATPASAAFLGKMAKKNNNAAVQVAAAQALAGRKDASARAELEAIKDDARVPGDVRAIASGRPSAPATPAQRDLAAAAANDAATTEPVRQMLKEHRNREAATWIVEKFQSLEPRAAIDVLGAWLRRQPAAAAAEGTTRAPAARPQTAAPAPAPPPGTATTSALNL